MSQADKPNWLPLEKFLPYHWCGQWMWMCKEDNGIHCYKHKDTRQYLHLSLDDRGAPVAWEYGKYGWVRSSLSFRGLVNRAMLGMNPEPLEVSR